MFGKTVIVIALALSLTPAVQAGDYFFVDQKHPQAADTNPGTEALPWKTVGHAAQTLKAGDTARIKAGRYREKTIQFAHSGERDFTPLGNAMLIGRPIQDVDARFLALEAYGDGEAILDGSVELPAEGWSLVEGRKNVYVSKVELRYWPGAQKPSQIVWVYLNDRLLLPNIAKVPGRDGKPQKMLAIPKDEDALLFYHDIEKGLLYLNLGGKTPAEAGRIEAAITPMAFDGEVGKEHIMLRGLTLQRYSTRTINFQGVRGGVIMDCLLRNCGGMTVGRDSIIRRCTIIDDVLVAISPSSNSLVDENLTIRNWRDPLPTRTGYQNTAITYFGQEYIRFRNNVVLESPANGFWPDCCSIGHLHIGNSVGYCEGNAFYIESIARYNALQYNVCFRNGNGITLRANVGNTVTENYFVGKNAGVVLSCTENAYMRDNQIVGNWFRDLGAAIVAGPGPCGQPQRFHFSDRNTFDTSVVSVAHWDSRGYKTLEEFQKGTGNEPHGVTRAFDPAELGLVSFRVAESSRPWEPCLMFGNPNMERLSLGVIGGFPYFYNVGTADNSDLMRWPLTLSKEMNQWLQTLKGCGGALRWASSGTFMVSRNAEDDKKILARRKNPADVGALEVASLTGTSIWSRALGYWTVSLPTAGGAKTHLRLHTIMRDVKEAAPGGGLAVFAEFSDYTRTRIAREFLAGRDDAGQNHKPDLTTGTRDYTPIEGTVTAPDWARRLRVFFGLRNCTGVAAFDDFDRFEVEPGQPPAEQAPATKTKPLLDPKTLSFQIVDLTKLLNRPLRDERADDGQGGWTDQGTGVDMADLRPGRKDYQGVPFEIAGPNSCLVLRTSCRPQSPNLPERVTITVARKADALYFLHDTAWCGDDVEMFSYIVRYDDGTQVAIPIVGGVNITDWAAGASAKFPHPPAGQRPSIAATVGGGTLFPQVNVYLLEWLNPQPGKTIQLVDFVSADTGVPILLGITTGAKK